MSTKKKLIIKNTVVAINVMQDELKGKNSRKDLQNTQTSMNNRQKIKISAYGTSATLTLLLVYTIIVSAISGRKFAVETFSQYWPFLVSLAVGFGIQVSLYAYLKELIHGLVSKKTVAVTGTTSTLAMISCCAHYLANILPILGIAGVLSVVAQYQIELFWVGIAFNLSGIAFIIIKIISASRRIKNTL